MVALCEFELCDEDHVLMVKGWIAIAIEFGFDG
jgi:hypothetical protein